MMSYPAQFPYWLNIAAQDGRGGLNGQPPSIIRGLDCSFRYNFNAHPTFGNWTGGVFSAELRASPDASGAPLASFAAVTGTPSGGVTPVTFSLPVGGQGSLPADTDGDGVTELLMQIDFAPDDGATVAIIQTRVLVLGAV